MTPEQEQDLNSALRAQGKPTFMQPGQSIGQRALNLGKDVGSNTLRGVNMIGTAVDNVFGLPGRGVAKLMGTQDVVPKGFSEQVGQATEMSTGSRTLGMGAGLVAAIASPDPIGDFKAGKKLVQEAGPKVFEGFTDLSTKVVERLKGKSSVSPQFIKDLAKGADVKEAEKKIITDVLSEYKDGKVPVDEFAAKVRTNLVPLTKKTISENDPISRSQPRYSGVNLPQPERGINYSEKIYESPIQTKAGAKHFGDESKNYFGHVRTEDITTPASGSFASMDDALEAGKKQGFTRRIVEVQSDLMQKEGLENEQYTSAAGLLASDNYDEMAEAFPELKNKVTKLKKVADELREYTRLGDTDDFFDNYQKLQVKYSNAQKEVLEVANNIIVNKKLEPLMPYKNSFEQRLLREEIKDAAQEGAKKMQVPTGSTAMKIEGLGSTAQNRFQYAGEYLAPDDIVVGRNVYDGPADMDWIITDDSMAATGQFEAIPRDVFVEMYDDFIDAGDEAANLTLEDFIQNEILDDSQSFRGMTESFGITPEVDKTHGVYKRYEKDIGKFLRSKYGAEKVTDDFGNEWWEFDIDPKQRDLPVEAFAAGAVPAFSGEREDQRSLE